MYFVAEQTEQRSGFKTSVALDFVSGAGNVVCGVATKIICWQGLKWDLIVGSELVCGQKSPSPPPYENVCHDCNFPEIFHEF